MNCVFWQSHHVELAVTNWPENLEIVAIVSKTPLLLQRLEACCHTFIKSLTVGDGDDDDCC